MRLISAGLALAALFLGFSSPTAAAPAPAVAEAAAARPAPLQPAVPQMTKPDLDAWLDGFFPNALKQADITGALVVVVKDGQVLTQRGYGWADLKKRIPMDPERTVFGVGSVSKTFVWTAVMQQVEQGKLDLDADVNTYLDIKVPEKFGKPITLRNLMTHSAGFEARAFRTLPDGEKPRNLRDYMRGTPVPNRIYPPGTVSAYSNYGSMMAGYIVERVSGEPFVDYIENHIMRPLGMAHSSFRRPVPAHMRADLSQSYETASNGEPVKIDNEEPNGDPSGHVNTTAPDIARFMLAHLQRGSYGGVQMLRPETADLMHRLAFKPEPLPRGMALGFFRMDKNGRRIIGHPGDILGYHADLEMLPDDGVGFFMMFNADGTGSGAVSTSNAVRWTFAQAFMDRYYPAAPLNEPTLATAEAHAAMAEGEYALSQTSTTNFQVASNLLAHAFVLKDYVKANDDGTITTSGFLSFLDGRPQTWREVKPFVWRQVGGDAELRMKVEDGQVVSFANSDVISVFISQRVPAWRAALPNMLLIIGALLVLMATVAAQPVVWLVRRSYGAAPALSPREKTARRATTAAAVIGVVYLLAWPFFILPGAGQLGFEPWIRLVQVIGLLCVPGAVIAGWNAWLAFKGGRSWLSRGWSLLVFLALVEVVFFSFAFRLITAGLNY